MRIQTTGAPFALRDDRLPSVGGWTDSVQFSGSVPGTESRQFLVGDVSQRAEEAEAELAAERAATSERVLRRVLRDLEVEFKGERADRLAEIQRENAEAFVGLERQFNDRFLAMALRNGTERVRLGWLTGNPDARGAEFRFARRNDALLSRKEGQAIVARLNIDFERALWEADRIAATQSLTELLTERERAELDRLERAQIDRQRREIDRIRSAWNRESGRSSEDPVLNAQLDAVDTVAASSVTAVRGAAERSPVMGPRLPLDESALLRDFLRAHGYRLAKGNEPAKDVTNDYLAWRRRMQP